MHSLSGAANAIAFSRSSPLSSAHTQSLNIDTWRPWISDVHIAVGCRLSGPDRHPRLDPAGAQSANRGKRIAALDRGIIPFLCETLPGAYAPPPNF